MNNLFCNLNSVASKLNIRVLDGNGNVLPALWMFRMVNSQIVFEGLDGVL